MAKQLLRAPLVYIPKGKLSPIEIENTLISLTKWAEQASRVINNLVSDIPSDSTATDVAGVVTDLNALQDVLRNLDTR